MVTVAEVLVVIYSSGSDSGNGSSNMVVEIVVVVEVR